MGAGYVGILSVELHFPEGGSLKAKRKHLVSAKAQLQRRFGASVAETDHHDLWQRATLTAAIVGRQAGPLREHGAGIERYVLGIYPDGARVETQLVSIEDLSVQ